MKKKEGSVATKAKKIVKKAVKNSSKASKKSIKSIQATKKLKSRAELSNKSNKKSKSKKIVKKIKTNKIKPHKSKINKVNLESYLTPLDDRLLVEPVNEERKTAGGIYIPDTVTNVSGYCHGIVLAIGRGHKNKKGRIQQMDVRCGDKILFSDYSGVKLDISNKEVFLIRESEVLGVITK